MYEFWMFFLAGLGYAASGTAALWAIRLGQFVIRGQQLKYKQEHIREQNLYIGKLERYKRDTQLAFQKLIVGVDVPEDEMTKYALADPTSEPMYPEK
jgi:hypothetical protein